MDANLLQIRDAFREAADIIDEICELETREENGEDVKKESESAMGRFMLKMLELNSLQ